MAAKYRKIDTRTWDDENFHALAPIEKLVALYVITAQSNRCGLFVYSHGQAKEHLGLESDSYDKAIANVLETLKWKYSKTTRVMYIPSWWKYNRPENQNHLKGCLSDLHSLPVNPLIKEFYENYTHLPDWGIQVLKDSYTHSYAKGIDPACECYRSLPTKSEAGAGAEAGVGTESEKSARAPRSEKNSSDSPPAVSTTNPNPANACDPPDADTPAGATPVGPKQERREAYGDKPANANSADEAAPDGTTVGTEKERREAREAFDRWSKISRRYGLKIVENEHRKIFDLMADLAQGPSVPRADGSVPAHRLVAVAADQLGREKAEFRQINYACKTVKNRIEKWIAEGIPITGTRNGRAPPAPLRKAVKYE